MSKATKILEAMRASPADHTERSCHRVLMHFGYEETRQARHGTFFRHAELLQHPDLAVRQRLAHVEVPKGRKNGIVRPYVVRDKILPSIDALLALREAPEGTGGE